MEVQGSNEALLLQTEAAQDGQCLYLPLDDAAVHTSTEGKPTHTPTHVHMYIHTHTCTHTHMHTHMYTHTHTHTHMYTHTHTHTYTHTCTCMQLTHNSPGYMQLMCNTLVTCADNIRA